MMSTHRKNKSKPKNTARKPAVRVRAVAKNKTRKKAAPKRTPKTLEKQGLRVVRLLAAEGPMRLEQICARLGKGWTKAILIIPIKKMRAAGKIKKLAGPKTRGTRYSAGAKARK